MITKVPVQRMVTVALNADNEVTHAWQQTTFSIQENGSEISQHVSSQENLEPMDLGTAIPHAAILKQISAIKASALFAAEEAVRVLAARDTLIESLRTENAMALTDRDESQTKRAEPFAGSAGA